MRNNHMCVWCNKPEDTQLFAVEYPPIRIGNTEETKKLLHLHAKCLPLLKAWLWKGER